jgi:demethylsterigmatocystin 6-O-methyltransferase
MSVPREGSWLDVVPFPDVATSMDSSDRAAFVDIGGNIGHQCARLKAKYPNLSGRVVLQDREETIKNAPSIEGVEFMVHDFFTPQPVKGMYITRYLTG